LWFPSTLQSEDLKTLRELSSDEPGRNEEIRAIVAETLAEERRLHHDDIDAVVFRAIATILTPFGIEEEDPKDSDTTDNLVSANNFIRAGYRLYQPEYP
jgi:hypothetical protein